MIHRIDLMAMENGARLKWTRLTPRPEVTIGILEHNATPDGESVINWPDGTFTIVTDRQAMHFVSLS